MRSSAPSWIVRASVLSALASGCTGGAAPTPPAAPPPRAALVMTGGMIVTADTSTVSAIAVDDGRVVDLGTDDALESWIGPNTKVIDLQGSTVVPGLVDSHMHLVGLGLKRFGLDLVGTTSLQQVVGKVRAAVKDAPKGTWIRGRGWDQNDWPSARGRFPKARDLDKVSPDHPVVLTRIDGHAVWVNSKAMQLSGITSKTKTPRGGQIIRARRRPTGIFVDTAMDLVREEMPLPGQRDLARAIKLAETECLTAGLTQVHDMGLSLREIAALRRLDDAGELNLRVYALHDGSVEDLSAAISEGPYVPESPDARLTVRGVKFMMDGALGSRGAALLEPYRDDRRNTGQILMDEALFEARVRSAKEKGFQVATHAIGDRANRIVLDTYQRVFGDQASALRPRIEHAQVLHPDDLPRLGALGIVASVQPTHATSDMPWAEARVGPERIRTSYAWQSLLSTTATIASGSDAPVEDVSPVLGLYAAILRKDLLGEPEGGWYPAEAMTPAQALASFSRGGAYASFREDDAGSIAIGNVADLTVLNRNPLTSDEAKLLRTKAQLTIIGGKVVFARPGADAAPKPPPPPPAPPPPVQPPAKTSTVATATST